MSGIAGVYFLDGQPVDQADLHQMVNILAHRGPDGSGVWRDGSAGLGHRMLWTTPESLHEKMPLVNQAKSLAITADARIDNREELINAFKIDDRKGSEISDSELILRAYGQWGERCPEELLGDFSFAIWDVRRQVLFCARDHMGVKPFYYYHNPGRSFIFASEIKAILKLKEVPSIINEVRIGDYLVPVLEDKAITFYKDILRLPPAHATTVSRKGFYKWQYWSLDPEAEIRYGSDEEYAEAFREVFSDAVRCRLRRALPVGSMLSGGLDSSSIVCVARQVLLGEEGRRLKTFSAVFDDVPQCDERRYINTVLEGGGLDPRFISADKLSPLTDLERLFWHEDEAFYAPNLFMHWELYKAAGSKGVRIVLDGFDGDTTVSHNLIRLTELARDGRWRTLISEINALSGRLGRSRRRIFRNHVLAQIIPEPIRRAERVLNWRNRSLLGENLIVNPSFSNLMGLDERYRDLVGNQSELLRTSKGNHYCRLNSGLLPFTLEVADRASAAFCVEPRYPFFDRRLVEFCLALPSEQKLSQGWTRVIMRRAMENILPEEIRWRGGKSNLSANFTRGLLRFEKELLERVIINNPRAIEEYVDMAYLREVYRRYAERATEDDALTVWKAVTLALWLNQVPLGFK